MPLKKTDEKIDDILLLDCWDQLFAKLGSWNFEKSGQKTVIKIASELRFAMISYLFRKNHAHDGSLGAEEIAQLIKACQATRPKKLNHRQRKQLTEITTSIINLTSSQESGNWRVHGKECYNFFWNPSDTQVIYCSIYHNIKNIFSNIMESSKISIDEHGENKNFKPAKYLIAKSSKKLDDFEPLKEFEHEETFINLALRVIQLSCVYIIENPYPTLLDNQQAKVATLLERTNHLMIFQANIHPVRRTIELLMILNKLSLSHDIFKMLIQEINAEFFNGKPYVQKIGNSIKFKAHWKYNYFEPGIYIESRISISEIITKRDQIPFTLVQQHLKNNPKNPTFFERFLNWFAKLFRVNKLQYVAPQYGYSKYNNNELVPLKQQYIQPEFRFLKT